MKKLLVVLLTLALCVSMLASCDFLKNFADIRGEGNNQETPKEFNVDAAAEYIYNLYKNKSVTATDFEVTAVANIAGVPHTVEWSVDTNNDTLNNNVAFGHVDVFFKGSQNVLGNSKIKGLGSGLVTTLNGSGQNVREFFGRFFVY
ncbi:MAG: hypothetical protein IJB94_02210, partial [Clostridia bacterium]|nr:hypothetical protein [Clostridia bacterium]